MLPTLVLHGPCKHLQVRSGWARIVLLTQQPSRRKVAKVRTTDLELIQSIVFCHAGTDRRLQQPRHAWVTPDSSCMDSCRTLGPGWRPATGGQFCKQGEWCSLGTTMSLCAGLIAMPGLGRLWVSGSTLASQARCDIKCPTIPCWNLPPGATHEND